MLVGGCVALGDEPLRHAALIELLRAASQQREGEEAAATVAGLATEQLLERLLTLVDDIDTSAPAILVVEDLHWADQGTCGNSSRVLARHIADRPAGLVLTCREDSHATTMSAASSPS